MTDWVWVQKRVVLLVHGELIAEHGGSTGTRDEGLLDSAMGRPQNLAAYDDPDEAALAASYAYGIAQNLAFVDGNKRAAFITAGIFLTVNGLRLTAPQPEAAVVFLELAAGTMTEDELAQWFRDRTEPA